MRLNVGIEFEIRLLATMSEQFDSGMHKFHNFTETVFIIQRGKNCFVALLPTENLIKQMDFYGNYIVTIVLWRFYADYHCRERSHTQTKTKSEQSAKTIITDPKKYHLMGNISTSWICDDSIFQFHINQLSCRYNLAVLFANLHHDYKILALATRK